MARSCRHEPDVRAAAVNGGWSDDLEQHLSGCRACAETRLVVAALRQPLRSSPSGADARLLWLSGRRARRMVVEARTSLAAAIVQTAALAVVFAALVSFLGQPAWWASFRATWGGPDSNVWISSVTAAGVAATIAIARWIRRDA